ncbi:MAG: RNA polymerase sigma factor [Spirochaetales bacterium]|nr:RNA polymerase sigma factor [Spirochaetales bacterium]
MTDFDSIYKQHYQRLYTLAFRMTGNREDSEDVMQSAFINAYKAYEKFRNQSSVYTWLYRIVLNTAKRFYRECRKLPVIEYTEEHGISQQDFYGHINSFGRVEDEVLTALTRETCLQMFMNCMPSKYRAVYTLRVMLSFSTSETAEILEIGESAVKVNLHRARKIAQEHMNDRCSLIHPGSICDCRSYAGFIVANDRKDILYDIEVIENSEKAAVRDYSAEMSVILQIDNMYNNQVKAPDHDDFITRVKRFKSEGKLRILGA